MITVRAILTSESVLTFFDERCELFGTHSPALMKAHFFMRFTVSNYPVAHARRGRKVPEFRLFDYSAQPLRYLLIGKFGQRFLVGGSS